MNKQSNWFQIARAIRRALAGNKHVAFLQGKPFLVAYEARKISDDRDYAIQRQLAQQKSCIFDIGANLGATTLLLSTALSPNGKLYAFEASETACRIIEENVHLNALSERVEVINAVVMASSGRVVDFYWDFASGGASTIAGYLGHDIPLQKISLAIDDFVEQKGIWPDFVKIDVEGAEYGVLQGMQRVLTERRPLVFVELHSWQDKTVAENASDILPYLATVQYKMFYLRQKTFVQDAAIFMDRGRCHVLLLPEEVALPENLDSSQL